MVKYHYLMTTGEEKTVFDCSPCGISEAVQSGGQPSLPKEEDVLWLGCAIEKMSH